MTPEAEAGLLARVGETIRLLSVESRQRLEELLAEGVEPSEAVMQALEGYGGAWVAELAIGMAIIHNAAITLSVVMDMPVAGVELSKHLYRNSRETAAAVTALIKQHAAAMMDARKLAMQMYEGYGFKDDEVLNLSPRNQALPRALRTALSDPAFKASLQSIIARAQAMPLKTPALKAAYLQALDALENGAGKKRLARLLDVAYQEKIRYYAKRIAVTELHREWDMIQEAEYLARDDLEFVQWRLSQTHERSDICDLYAKQDKYGLGPGCYPKALAPRAPAHPFCRCIKAPRLDLTGAKVLHKHGADRAYLRTLPLDEAAKVAGSKAKLRGMLKGEDVADDYGRGLLRARLNADNGGMEIKKFAESALKVADRKIELDLGSVNNAARIKASTQCCSLNDHRCPVLTDIHDFIALARRILLGSSLDHARI